jgi:hypothetical protein
LIGTDVTGTLTLGNALVGVTSGGSISNALIGGTTVDARNIISANNRGIALANSSSNNMVQGNFVGTEITGRAPLRGRDLAYSGNGRARPPGAPRRISERGATQWTDGPAVRLYL